MAMFLNLQASKPPTLVISPTSINVTIPGNVNVTVKDPSSNATKPAFTIGIVRPPHLENFHCPLFILSSMHYLISFLHPSSLPSSSPLIPSPSCSLALFYPSLSPSLSLILSFPLPFSLSFLLFSSSLQFYTN